MFENIFGRAKYGQNVTVEELREVLIPVITTLSERISDLERRVDVLEHDYLEEDTIWRI